MAGLLHDIGVLRLVKLDPAATGSWAPGTALDAAAERVAEQAHFGCTHEGAALVIVQAW